MSSLEGRALGVCVWSGVLTLTGGGDFFPGAWSSSAAGLGGPLPPRGALLPPPQAFLFPELCSLRKWTLAFQQEAVSYISLVIYRNTESPSDVVVNPDAGKMAYGTRMEVILHTARPSACSFLSCF